MPVFNRLFTELPAETDIPASKAADKVNQSDAIVLQIATDFRQFIHIILQMGQAILKAVLHDRLRAGLSRLKLLLQLRNFRVRSDNIRHDAAYQRKRFVGFLYTEAPLGTRGRHGFRSQKLWACHGGAAFLRERHSTDAA